MGAPVIAFVTVSQLLWSTVVLSQGTRRNSTREERERELDEMRKVVNKMVDETDKANGKIGKTIGIGGGIIFGVVMIIITVFLIGAWLNVGCFKRKPEREPNTPKGVAYSHFQPVVGSNSQYQQVIVEPNPSTVQMEKEDQPLLDNDAPGPSSLTPSTNPVPTTPTPAAVTRTPDNEDRDKFPNGKRRPRVSRTHSRTSRISVHSRNSLRSSKSPRSRSKHVISKRLHLGVL